MCVLAMFINTGVPSTTRTIRIKKESDLVLEREAERHGLSVNALVSNLVDRYVDSLRFFQSGGMVSMSGDTLMALLDTMDEDELTSVSSSRGVARVRDSLLQRGMKVNYDSVLWYICQILGQYNGWFRCDYHRGDASDSLHLSHSYDYKWSVFILNYVNSVFMNVLDVKTNTVASNNAVNIEIMKKKITTI